MNTPAQILAAVARAYCVRVPAIMGKSRSRTISLARQTCAYLLRARLHFSYHEIARELGLVDHSSARTGGRRIAAALTDDATITVRVRAAEALLDVGLAKVEAVPAGEERVSA